MTRYTCRTALVECMVVACVYGAACSSDPAAPSGATTAKPIESQATPARTEAHVSIQSAAQSTSAPARTMTPGPRVLRRGGDGAETLAPSWSAKSEGADRSATCTDPKQVTVEGVPNRRSIAASDLKTARGRISFSDGRQRTQVGLPLDALVAQAHGDTIEVTPCEGPPVRWTVAEVRHRAGQFVVVPTSHGALKVVERRPARANVAADFPAGIDVVTRARHIHTIRVFLTPAPRVRT